MKRAFVLILIFVCPSLTFAEPDFDKAEKKIKFLKPGDVKSFPMSVKKDLEAKDCLIPIVPGAQGPTGWAKGSFAERGQTDWAVLCSNKSGKSQINIIWGGKKPCPNFFGTNDNKNYLQTQDENTIMFSRMIGSIGPTQVVKYLKKAKASTPQSFVQDGIVDSFVGKGSTVRFCTAGIWQEVMGAD